MTINDCVNSKQKVVSSCILSFHDTVFFSTIEERTDKEMEKLISPTNNISVPTVPVTNPR